MSIFVRAALAVIALVASWSSSPAAAETLILGSPHEAAKGTHGGLLARQLVRQAFLLAAREQFGLATRDVELRQTGELPAKLVRRAVEVWSEIRPEEGLVVEVHRSRGVAGEKVLQTNKPLPAAAAIDYVALAERCEELSRHEFPAALTKLGYPAGEPKSAGDGKVPADVERQLARMTFLSQFLAIRALHAAMRADGPSPPLVGGLVRGYANLGLLTEPHLDASSKAYAARALVYAQRLVSGSPNSAFARRHRAYALALAGLHAAAQKDLATAARLADDKPGETPQWTPLVESLCRFDPAGLAPEKTSPSLHETANLFHFVVNERALLSLSEFDFPRTQQAAEAPALAIAKQLPDCERADSVDSTIFADVTPKVIFSQAWYRMLADATDAPQSVRAAAEEAIATFALPAADRRQRAARSAAERERRNAVVKALHDVSAADPGELPYSALAAWIEQRSFLEAWRESSAADHALLGAADAAADVRTTLLPLIERHPLAKFIEARLAGSDSRRLETAVAAWRGLDTVSVHGSFRLLNELFSEEPAGTISAELGAAIARHRDDTYRDLVDALGHDEADSTPDLLAKRLAAISPDAPLAAVAMIRHIWPTAKETAGLWENRHASHLEVQAVLAERYLAENRFDDARRCLARYVRLSPDEFGYTHLAETYLAQGNSEHWLATLEEFLQQQSNDPTASAGVQATIARHFIELGQLTRALPYAEQAAENGHTSGSLAAAECHEYSKNWPLAEKFYRQADERSDEPVPMHWLAFCVRTGYGSINAARAKAAESARETPAEATAQSLARAGEVHLLLNHPRSAMRLFRQSVDKGGDAATALRLAVLAIEQKQSPAAEAALKLAIAKTRSHQTHLAEIAHGLERFLRTGGKTTIDENLMRRLADVTPIEARADALYFVGRLLELQADHGRSREGFRRCAACPTPSVSRTLACASLRAVGEEPNDERFDNDR
jgi:tetratricopeptide (TPR) repeat protein